MGDSGKLSNKELNKVITSLRKEAKKAVLFVSRKAERKAKLSKKSKDEKKRLRAERLAQLLSAIRKFAKNTSIDDVTKFALVNVKKFEELYDAGETPIEKHALYKVATSPNLVRAIDEIRVKYPNWHQEIPFLLQRFGQQSKQNKELAKEKKSTENGTNAKKVKGETVVEAKKDSQNEPDDSANIKLKKKLNKSAEKNLISAKGDTKEIKREKLNVEKKPEGKLKALKNAKKMDSDESDKINSSSDENLEDEDLEDDLDEDESLNDEESLEDEDAEELLEDEDAEESLEDEDAEEQLEDEDAEESLDDEEGDEKESMEDDSSENSADKVVVKTTKKIVTKNTPKKNISGESSFMKKKKVEVVKSTSSSKGKSVAFAAKNAKKDEDSEDEFFKTDTTPKSKFAEAKSPKRKFQTESSYQVAKERKSFPFAKTPNNDKGHWSGGKKQGNFDDRDQKPQPGTPYNRFPSRGAPSYRGTPFPFRGKGSEGGYSAGRSFSGSGDSAGRNFRGGNSGGRNFSGGGDSAGRNFRGGNSGERNFSRGGNSAGRNFSRGGNSSGRSFSGRGDSAGRNFSRGGNSAGRNFSRGGNSAERNERLHPSWEAAQRKKEQMKTLFNDKSTPSKRMKFND